MKKYQMASIIRAMSKPLPPSRTAPQFVVRFQDEEMRDRLKAEADKNGRSMNAEILARLEGSFDAAKAADATLLMQFYLSSVESQDQMFSLQIHFLEDRIDTLREKLDRMGLTHEQIKKLSPTERAAFDASHKEFSKAAWEIRRLEKELIEVQAKKSAVLEMVRKLKEVFSNSRVQVGGLMPAVK